VKVFCQAAVCAFDVPPPTGLDRSVFAFVGDLAVRAALVECGAGLGGVVSGVQAHGDLAWERAEIGE
jgi:hypothetical protein